MVQIHIVDIIATINKPLGIMDAAASILAVAAQLL